MKKLITSFIIRQGLTRYRWARMFIGGKWRYGQDDFDTKLYWANDEYAFYFSGYFKEEDWDFYKWFKKVQNEEESIDIFLATDEAHYKPYYEQGLTPEQAVKQYLNDF